MFLKNKAFLMNFTILLFFGNIQSAEIMTIKSIPAAVATCYTGFQIWKGYRDEKQKCDLTVDYINTNTQNRDPNSTGDEELRTFLEKYTHKIEKKYTEKNTGNITQKALMDILDKNRYPMKHDFEKIFLGNSFQKNIVELILFGDISLVNIIIRYFNQRAPGETFGKGLFEYKAHNKNEFDLFWLAISHLVLPTIFIFPTKFFVSLCIAELKRNAGFSLSPNYRNGMLGYFLHRFTPNAAK